MKLCPQCESGYHDSHTTCPTHGGVLNEIRDLRSGMLIHKTYRIVRKLGRGGMGTVYLADHVFMHEQRALKFLAPELCEDAEFTERFRREVWTLKQIRHRNVIHCGDLEPAEDDSLFFAMEYVEGPDLREFLKHTPKPMDLNTALGIARGIAEGLGAAHALGMVHRDIKPENILMARPENEWRPKIADFGIVATRESTGHRTRTGGTLLTMQYAAPEQWRGMRSTELDGRTDLYALGCVIYEMLTGQPPFEAETYEEWAEKHKNALPAAPSQLRPELANSPGLDLLLWRMLAKDRAHRPADAAEVIAAIDASLNAGQAAASRYQTLVEPPPFAPFQDAHHPTQLQGNLPEQTVFTEQPSATDPRRNDSGGRSVPPPFEAKRVESGRPGMPPVWNPPQNTAPNDGGTPPVPDWLPQKEEEIRKQEPLATFLLGNLGFSGQLIFAVLLGLNAVLQIAGAIRVRNGIQVLTGSITALGCVACGVTLVLLWKRKASVQWLWPVSWFTVALVKTLGAVGTLASFIPHYSIEATFIRFGSVWLGSLCVASAAVYFGLRGPVGTRQRTKTGLMQRLAPIGRICFVVLLMLLGILDILRISPFGRYMALGPSAVMCLFGVAETAFAIMLLARFRIRMAAIALAAVYVLLVPVELFGNLQALHTALRMVPLIAVTLPSFLLAMAGGILALEDDTPAGASLDTSPHTP